MRDKQFAFNRYGVGIVRCCASCGNCRYERGVRTCVLEMRPVPSSYLCSSWRLKEPLERAGKGDGKVKRYRYLQYALDRLTEDDAEALAAAERNEAYRRLEVSEIRRDFLNDNDTIYDIER